MANPASLAGFAGAVGAGASFAFKNRIINGAMMIDQRNGGASVTSSGGAGANWAVDRFQANVAGTSAVVTAQRVSDAPSGFINSLKITVTTAATATAAQFTFVRQIIEGLNISDLGWGTADAQPVTLSFWVKASITGTYSAFAINHAEDRSYVGTFAVNAANTWEYKTITVPGDTTGTWLTTNSNGIRLGFDLGSGSNFQGTGNAWNSGWRQRTSSTVNFIGTNGATFQFTGVQLEKGSVATPFEFRSIGQELALCQRYYQIIDAVMGVMNNATQFTGSISFPVQMRTAPSVGLTGVFKVTDTYFSDYTQASASIQISASRVSSTGVNINCGDFSGMNQGRAAMSLAGQTGRVTLSAEL